jgi:DNA repair exonuclease SbcCD ATPase subunit
MENRDPKYNAILQELVRRSNDEMRRLRDVEQRIESIENRLNSIEDINLDRIKKSNAKFASIENSIRQINEDILMLKNSLEKFNRQVASFARKRDIKEVEKMMDLLSPLKEEFVTKEELMKELQTRS